MTDELFDFLVRQQWQDIDTWFHNLISGITGHVFFCVICFLIVYVIARKTMKKHG